MPRTSSCLGTMRGQAHAVCRACTCVFAIGVISVRSLSVCGPQVRTACSPEPDTMHILVSEPSPCSYVLVRTLAGQL